MEHRHRAQSIIMSKSLDQLENEVALGFYENVSLHAGSRNRVFALEVLYGGFSYGVKRHPCMFYQEGAKGNATPFVTLQCTRHASMYLYIFSQCNTILWIEGEGLIYNFFEFE